LKTTDFIEVLAFRLNLLKRHSQTQMPALHGLTQGKGLTKHLNNVCYIWYATTWTNTSQRRFIFRLISESSVHLKINCHYNC